MGWVLGVVEGYVFGFVVVVNEKVINLGWKYFNYVFYGFGSSIVYLGLFF